MEKLKTLQGMLKDEASQLKLNVLHICSSENDKNIEVALLKATSHTSHDPPKDKYVTFLQSTTNTLYAPQTIRAIIQRLHSTKDVCVAAKCLILIHKMIKSENGSNDNRTLIYNQEGSNLKLNDLNVSSSSFTRELFPWVQWYKQYLDCYLSIAEALEGTPNIKDTSEAMCLETNRISSQTIECIFEQICFLVNLFEHVSGRPEVSSSKLNAIVVEMRIEMVKDYFSVMNLIKLRFEELNKRGTKPNDLGLVLERLEKCKEGLNEFTWQRKYLVDDFWSVVSTLKDL